MKYFKLISVILLISSLLGEKELDKVSLQSQWLEQFHFSGYSMAKEKGFDGDLIYKATDAGSIFEIIFKGVRNV